MSRLWAPLTFKKKKKDKNRHVPVIYWVILSFFILQTLSLYCYSPCKCRLCYHTGENICIDFWIHEGLLPLHGSCSSYSHTWVCKSKPWVVAVRHRTDVTKIAFLLLSRIFIDVVPSNHLHNCTYSNDIIYYWKAGSSEGAVATVSHTKQHHTTDYCRKCSASEKKHNQLQELIAHARSNQIWSST